MNRRISVLTSFNCLTFLLLPAAAQRAVLLPDGASRPALAQASQPSIARVIGVIKTINGNTLTVAPTSGGPEITAVVQPNARILKLESGEKDAKNATPIQLQDLQVGDTVRVRGFAAQDAASIPALEVLVITRSAVSAESDKIREDWQKRGLGGLVTAVDPAGTISISVTGFAGKKSIAIHTSKNTIFRRYAPNSVKFEDARPSSLAQVKAGDQLRARGERSADGSEFTADEVVTGSFRNIAGLVNSVDASLGLVTVQDVLSKKPVQVKITSDSQLHQLPPEVAQRIAMRLKASMSGAVPAGAPAAGGSPAQAGSGPPNGTESGAARAGMGMRAGGGDLQQFLSRQPAVTIADLHKGDAVMMVATEGSPSAPSTAINLVSGVDPILRAAPNGSEAMMMTPWSLGGGAPGGDAGN